MTSGLEVLPDAAAVARRGAEVVIAQAQAAAAARGVFALALSGGQTPAPLYGQLARRDVGGRLPWRRTYVYWVDERCVPPDDPDSNYGMVRHALLDRVDLPDGNVHRMHGEEAPAEAAAAYEVVLRSPPLGTGVPDAGPAGPEGAAAGPPRRRSAVAAPGSPRPGATLPGAGGVPDGSGESRLPVFDFVLLGLGADGHTASLFPHAEALKEEERLCVATETPDGAQRLSLTLPIINAARQIMFVVTGAEKAGMVAEVLEGLRIPDSVPAQGVAPRLGEVLWLLDEAAAAELGGAEEPSTGPSD